MNDVKIGKNYLSEAELMRLNLLVSQFLDFAKFQALEQIPMTIESWFEALDGQILAPKAEVAYEQRLHLSQAGNGEGRT